jgi:hypothetical protein
MSITDGRSQPEGFAYVARIGTLITAGQREYCELPKSPSFSLELGFVPNNQVGVILITRICALEHRL